MARRFDGDTLECSDRDRLSGQLSRTLMRDHRWRGLAEIATAVGGSEAGVSARLRDLRKQKFGGFIVDRRRVGDRGIHQYRLIDPIPRHSEQPALFDGVDSNGPR